MKSQLLQTHEIKKLLPYNCLWLQIDRVLEWTSNKSITTQKSISISDPLVASHFADGPFVVPGVLLIEMVSQSAMLLSRLSDPTYNELVLLASCRAQFISPAVAGDELRARVELQDVVRGCAVHKASVYVGTREVCRVSIISSPQAPIE
jgi:3-hydroxyacyl-[acyl-carrier-protein] dehydratase